MTEQVDLDALITEKDRWPDDSLVYRLADALESTLSELRQERERADAEHYAKNRAKNAHLDTKDALSRAEGTIEKAARLIECNEPWVAHTALTGYGKQKEQA